MKYDYEKDVSKMVDRYVRQIKQYMKNNNTNTVNLVYGSFNKKIFSKLLGEHEKSDNNSNKMFVFYVKRKEESLFWFIKKHLEKHDLCHEVRFL